VCFSSIIILSWSRFFRATAAANAAISIAAVVDGGGDCGKEEGCIVTFDDEDEGSAVAWVVAAFSFLFLDAFFRARAAAMAAMDCESSSAINSSSVKRVG
jgi:hypothetical protein